MRICGIVVLYNPSFDVIENILTYEEVLNKLYVCDNSDKKNTELLNNLSSFDNVEVIDLKGNKGIAKALKVGMDCAVRDDFDFCLTMDQDSKFPTEQIGKVLEYLNIDNINQYGIIGLNFNSQSYEKGLIETKTWLTSGNFINISNYKKISGFNEELFIDYVDFELNEQFAKIGKKTAFINEISLKHTIGNPIRKRMLFLKFTCMNHSPIRYYYRYRNSLYLYKCNKKFYKKKYKHDLYIETLKMILFEKNKIQKIKMIKKGRKDAKKGILGKYNLNKELN